MDGVKVLASGFDMDEKVYHLIWGVFIDQNACSSVNDHFRYCKRLKVLSSAGDLKMNMNNVRDLL